MYRVGGVRSVGRSVGLHRGAEITFLESIPQMKRAPRHSPLSAAPSMVLLSSVTRCDMESIKGNSKKGRGKKEKTMKSSFFRSTLQFLRVQMYVSTSIWATLPEETEEITIRNERRNFQHLDDTYYSRCDLKRNVAKREIARNVYCAFRRRTREQDVPLGF